MNKYIKLFEDFTFNENEFDSEFEFSIDVHEFCEKILEELNISYQYLKVIDEGSNGIAFDLGDKVLKLTSDDSEAHYADKLIDINSDHLVNVYSVNKVESEYQYGDLYCIIMEKLNTDFHKTIKYMINDLHKPNNITNKLSNNIEPNDNDILELFDMYSYDDSKKIEIFYLWYSVYKECLKYGLPMDDMRGSNIGIRNKKMVFFDISSIYELRTLSNDIDIINI
jgi:hypothetical protein